MLKSFFDPRVHFSSLYLLPEKRKNPCEFWSVGINIEESILWDREATVNLSSYICSRIHGKVRFQYFQCDFNSGNHTWKSLCLFWKRGGLIFAITRSPSPRFDRIWIQRYKRIIYSQSLGRHTICCWDMSDVVMLQQFTFKRFMFT